MFKIGFSGTRHGMTDEQYRFLFDLFDAMSKQHKDIEFHHGQCIGADEQALVMAREFKFKTVAHPSTLVNFTSKEQSNETREKKPPLDRNHDIVDECDVLIACPESSEGVLRSGTWSTIRYSMKLGKPTMIKGAK